MMESKKISIITINYNNRSGLQKTLDSVFGQTYQNFEYIVIDGDSTDGSKDLLHQNTNRISYWVSEPDTGIYNAMNKGIRVATSEYLLFLNSGDCLCNASVLEEIEASIDGTIGIYYGDITYMENDILRVRSFPRKLSFGFFYLHNISHQASFINKSLFETLFYYNESYRIASDWEFFIYAICKANISYKHLDKVITEYDATGISSNINNHKMMNLERQQTIMKYFPLFADDYATISQLESKRFKKFMHIKEYRPAWALLNALMNIILVFLPKTK